MNTQATARLVSAIAAPLFLLHAHPARCQAALPATTAQMAHVPVASVGRGAPVVLIPGLASPRAVRTPTAAPLAATDHRVLLVQINGFGQDAPGANLQPGILDQPAAFAAAVTAFVR